MNEVKAASKLFNRYFRVCRLQKYKSLHKLSCQKLIPSLCHRENTILIPWVCFEVTAWISCVFFRNQSQICACVKLLLQSNDVTCGLGGVSECMLAYEKERARYPGCSVSEVKASLNCYFYTIMDRKKIPHNTI